MRLTERQQAVVSHYAEWPRRLAFSRRISLQYHDRLDLAQYLALELIRVVLTYPGENLHAAVIHRVRLKRTGWLCDRGRLRRGAVILTDWSPDDDERAPDPPPVQGGTQSVDDRDELDAILDELPGFRAQALRLRYCEGRDYHDAARVLGHSHGWVARETRAGLDQARAQARSIGPLRR